jgi:hypothetical protein
MLEAASVKSHNIHISRTTLKCDLCHIVQQIHSTAQQIVSFPTDIGCLLQGHLAIEPIAIPSPCPLIPYSRGKPRPISKANGVKSNAAKLSSEGTLRPLELNLVVPVVQLIVLSENISSRMLANRVS